MINWRSKHIKNIPLILIYIQLSYLKPVMYLLMTYFAKYYLNEYYTAIVLCTLMFVLSLVTVTGVSYLSFILVKKINTLSIELNFTFVLLAKFSSKFSNVIYFSWLFYFKNLTLIFSAKSFWYKIIFINQILIFS